MSVEKDFDEALKEETEWVEERSTGKSAQIF
jgi:hypothetical protein